MSVVALRQSGREPGIAPPAIRGLARSRAAVAAFALGVPLAFYLLLLAVLIVRYGNLPNYVTPHDWISNVLRIVASTQSIADMVPIILDEWLLEIGRMNYDYGKGIADWSLAVVPHKLALVALAGALVGLNVGLLLAQRPIGTFFRQGVQAVRFGVLTSVGVLCASVPNATVFSVVHCATPSWVGSLAVLGFDSYDVFALEPFGPLIGTLGFALLIGSALLIVRDARIPLRRSGAQASAT